MTERTADSTTKAIDIRKKETRETPYQAALQRLRVLTTSNAEVIFTMEDFLSAMLDIPDVMVTVAEVIKRRARAAGGEYAGLEFSPRQPEIMLAQSISGEFSLGDEGSSIRMLWDEKVIHLNRGKDITEDSMYHVVIPRTITKVEAWALDNEADRAYSPVEDDSIDSRQGYLSVLQKGIVDLLAILPTK